MSVNPRRITLSRRLSDWWDNDGEFATAPGKLVQIKGRALAVDPAMTSPNVFVAIRQSPGDEPIVLRPGETLVFSETVTSVYVANPLISMLSFTDNHDGLCTGVVSLLSGTIADLVAWRSRANRTRVLPVAALLGAGLLHDAPPANATSGPGQFVAVCCGVEWIRLSLYPLDAAGALMESPADLAGSITPYIQRRLPITPNTAIYDHAKLIDGFDLNSGEYGPAGARGMWSPDVSNKMDFSQFQTTFDLQVGGASGLLAFPMSGLAGTDVVSILAVVEGL